MATAKKKAAEKKPVRKTKHKYKLVQVTWNDRDLKAAAKQAQTTPAKYMATQIRNAVERYKSRQLALIK